MGKLFNALVLSGFASIVLFLFDGVNPDGVMGKFFMSPHTDWGTIIISMFTSVLGLSTAVGLTAIVVGLTIIRMDWIVRAGMFITLVSWVEAPFISLWQFMGSKIYAVQSCTGNWYCTELVQGASTSGMLLAGLIMGPLVFYSLWACFNYIWAPESSG